MIRVWTGTASQVGSCDQCSSNEAAAPGAPDQVITALTLHREDAIVFLARFCEKHFLQFSDLISNQVAALLYPIQKSR